MASETLQKFAEELRTAREAKGISILQIHSRTKIDPKFLSAIENAEFEILPELYVRAFIKEFAQTIDLNPKEVIQKFDIAKAGLTEKASVKESTVQSVQTPEQGTEKILEHEKRTTDEFSAQQPKEVGPTHTIHTQLTDEQPKKLFYTNLNVIIGVIVLIVAAVVFYFALFYESSPEIIADQQEQTVSEKSERFEVTKPVPAAVDSVPVAPIISDSLRLLVQNSEQVWVKVLSDGKIIKQGIVQKNTTLNFKAMKQFGISIGNAGVVKLFFNEKPVKNVGRLGEIRNITITPDTIRYLTIPRNEKKLTSPNR